MKQKKVILYTEELLREGEVLAELLGELRGELKGQIAIIEKMLQAGFPGQQLNR